jgi:hypothetical protein
MTYQPTFGGVGIAVPVRPLPGSNRIESARDPAVIPVLAPMSRAGGTPS